MEQYINKAAVVAEIERRMKLRNDSYKKYYCASDFIAFEELEYFRDEFIPTLEVKEVDLEKEYEEFVVDDPIFGNFITNDTMGMKLAKHFFELGFKAQKGE